MAAPITDKVVVVTGASAGIGPAVAQKLAEAGAKVVLAARRLERLQEVKKSIDSAGGRCIAVKCDVTKRDEVAELVKQTEAAFGGIDVLVNNAGVFYFSLMKNVNHTQWDHMVDVNIKGTLNCTAAVLPGMVQRGQGHIVIISSDSGRMPFPGLAVYTGTKYFLEGWAQSMRIELVDTGVKVTSIQPGSVVSEIGMDSNDQEALAKYNFYSEADMMQPSDVAGAVLYAVNQPQYCAVNEILLQPRIYPR